MLEVTNQENEGRPFEVASGGEAAFHQAVAELECGIVLTADDAASLKAYGPMPSMENDRRRFVRFACSARGILDCEQTLPAIPRSAERFLVLVKNVSRTGICFLHAAQLFPREKCRLWIEGRRPMSVEVTRCRRLHQGCYEIGVCFQASGNSSLS